MQLGLIIRFFCYYCCCCFLSRNNKAQYRGKLNLIGRLQLSTEKNREEENQEIVFLRTERTKVIYKYIL